MQKVLRINLQARNQGLKKARRENLKSVKQQWRDFDQRVVARERATRTLVNNERKSRREDWIAGPLAPNRNTGQQAGKYGTVNASLAVMPTYPKDGARHGGGDHDPVSEDGHGEEKRRDWFGNHRNLLVGDRVCVVRGREGVKGMIGKIKTLKLARKEVTIEGLNTADIELPEGTPGRARQAFQAQELPLSMDDVRLVHTLRDEATGREREVIVKHLRGGGPYVRRDIGAIEPRHTRYIAGLDIEIPWPLNQARTPESYPAVDTRQLDLDRETYTPSLYDPPLPVASIADELRPKYRADRTWHEEEYVKMKVLEDARSKWYEDRKVLSPVEEAKAKKREEAESKAKLASLKGPTPRTMLLISQERAATRGDARSLRIS